ncbi:MAG: DinB family protein [Saprospirales bacterium]|nr:MAG: DinB family protein [Saprospirales bacterium]
MKTIYIFSFCLLYLFSCINLSAQYLNEVITKWENATSYTLDIADLMPAEHYEYRPTPEIMSFAEQLLHMTANMNWLGNSYLNANSHSVSELDSVSGKEDILTVLNEGFENAVMAFKNISIEELDDEVEFFAGPMTKRQIIHLMNDHLTHHRGQLIIYLRMKGIKPPRYVGW